MKFSWIVGLRFLTSRQKAHISFITVMAVVGVTIGVAALLIITAISTGFLEAFKEKVLGVNAHIIVLKVGSSFHEYRDVTSVALKEEGVVAGAPFIITEMMIVRGKSISGILIKGIEPALASKILDLPKHIIQGKLESLEFVPIPPVVVSREQEIDVTEILEEEAASERDGNATFETPKESGVASQVGVQNAEDAHTESASEVESHDLPGMIVGKTLAENLNARLGDEVRVISPLTGLDASFVDESIDPSLSSISASFRITGIFYSGFDEYDSRLVYVNLKQAQQLFGYGDSVTGVELRVRDIDRAKEMARSLEGKLSGGLYRIIDWNELNHSLFTALFIQKIALTVVLMLSVLMASLNIISMLVLFITSKKRDIAILKAMGATKLQITSIFLIVGALTGVVGLVLGSGLGLAICQILIAYGWPLDPKVYLIDHLPLKLTPLDFLLCSCFTMIVCLTFTAAPALKAASLDPIEGIKYE